MDASLLANRAGGEARPHAVGVRYPRDPVLYEVLIECESVKFLDIYLSGRKARMAGAAISTLPVVWTIFVSFEGLASKTYFFDGCYSPASPAQKIPFQECYECNGGSIELPTSKIRLGSLVGLIAVAGLFAASRLAGAIFRRMLVRPDPSPAASRAPTLILAPPPRRCTRNATAPTSS